MVTFQPRSGAFPVNSLANRPKSESNANFPRVVRPHSDLPQRPHKKKGTAFFLVFPTTNTKHIPKSYLKNEKFVASIIVNTTTLQAQDSRDNTIPATRLNPTKIRESTPGEGRKFSEEANGEGKAELTSNDVHAAEDDYAGAQEREERREDTPLRRRRHRPVGPGSRRTAAATSSRRTALTTPEPAQLPLLRRYRHRRRQSQPPLPLRQQPRSQSGGSEPHRPTASATRYGESGSIGAPPISRRLVGCRGRGREKAKRRRGPANPERSVAFARKEACFADYLLLQQCLVGNRRVYTCAHASDRWDLRVPPDPTRRWREARREARSCDAWLGMTCGPIETCGVASNGTDTSGQWGGGFAGGGYFIWTCCMTVGSESMGPLCQLPRLG